MSETSVHTAAFTRHSVTAKISVMTLATMFPETFRRVLPADLSVARGRASSAASARAVEMRCYPEAHCSTGCSMIVVDAATHADLAAVQALARRIWFAHYPGIISIAQIEYMLERGYDNATLTRFLDSPGAGLALARDPEPIGFAAWYRTEAPATSKLDKLYVAIEHRGKGVGRRLIEHVEQAARRDGSSALVLNVAKRNEASIAIYRHCGFSVRDEVVVDIGNGFVMDDYVMAKPL
jgi:diamine N-acetyltransferase